MKDGELKKVKELKSLQDKLEEAEKNLEKVKADAKKEYFETVAKARKEVEDLQKENAQVTKEVNEVLEKAGYELVKKGTVKRTYIYPDLHPDLRDFIELSNPVWIAPLWQKPYPTDPPYRQTHFKWSSTSDYNKNPINQSITWQAN